MKFILQIEVDSFEEAEQIVASLRHSAPPTAVAQVEAQVTGSFSAGDMTEAAAQGFRDGQRTASNEPQAEVTAKRRGRPRKEQAAPVAESGSESSNPATDVPNGTSVQSEQPLSIDDVREALRGVQANGIGDVPRQLALLQKYGAQRVTELKADNYAAFIADCKAA